MTGLGREFRYVMRRLVGKPGIVAAVVVSIGIGIAANATIFAMVSRFVLHAAPVGDPATLVSVHTTHDGDQCCNNFSWPTFADVRDQAQSFSGVAAFDELIPASISGKGDPERIWGQATTTNYFDVAQLGMTVGRGFRPDEEYAQVIVLGHRLWQRRFSGDPAIVGKSITLSGRPYTVVGVAPTGYRGIDFVLDPEFWVPLGNGRALNPSEPPREARDYHWLDVIARYKPGVTHEQADAELKTLAARLAATYPAIEKGNGFRFEQAGSLPPRQRGAILTFLAALSIVVLLVLCIAGANVANLLLAQAAERSKEMAVRLTLGASRGALQRLMLMESVILALGGGLFGFALSLWATQTLSAFHLPAPVPLDLNIHADWRVLLYTFALSVGAGVVLGIAPAWAASHPILSSALKGEGVLAGPRRRWNLRSVLVVSQVAMSVVLLCATGLFLRSMQNASGIDIGFRSRGVLITSVDPRVNGYSAEKTVQFLKQLRERVAGLPGVSAAVCTDIVPLSEGGRSDGFTIAGQPAPDGGPITDLYMATSGYFDVMGIPRLEGRDFANESPAGPKVAIVNQEFVTKVLGGREAIGQRVDGGGVIYEIVGVVKNSRSRTLGEAQRPVLFRSLEQTAGNDPAFLGYSLLVRTSGGDYSALEGAVRQEIRALDPAMATYNEMTMEQHLRDALFLPRMGATLFGVFGVSGVLLAAVGLYGVMSYAVSRRTKEIGIRMALGAQVGGVQKMIVGQGMRLAAIALGLGLIAAMAVARLFTAFLYGVRTDDVATFVSVPVLLGIVVLTASWIPARRAARVDPMVALRWE
ncbi:MAG TPA: ABC transporter permease [Candidatus Acidoferrum sp.]|jgi:predicted permease